jgi:hypothetical protein
MQVPHQAAGRSVGLEAARNMSADRRFGAQVDWRLTRRSVRISSSYRAIRAWITSEPAPGGPFDRCRALFDTPTHVSCTDARQASRTP